MRSSGGDLSAEERKVIRALRRLAKAWPAGLWLYSANGSLHLMREGPGGQREKGGYADPALSIYSTRKIPNDGGDW